MDRQQLKIYEVIWWGFLDVLSYMKRLNLLEDKSKYVLCDVWYWLEETPALQKTIPFDFHEWAITTEPITNLSVIVRLYKDVTKNIEFQPQDCQDFVYSLIPKE